MKKTILALGLIIAFQSLADSSSFYKYHIIKETRESNQTHYVVIKEDVRFKDNQNQISQDVIYKKISFDKNEKQILNEYYF